MSQDSSTPNLQQRVAELQAEVERQEQRIADLEQAAGLAATTQPRPPESMDMAQAPTIPT
jgi:uncharacterized protein YlxW (UPF0749 family)